MKAIIFGATGLSGRAITDVLLADDSFHEVVLFVRKSTGRKHPKLKEILRDFDNIASQKADIEADVIFNCLGTTIKKAGSKAAQQLIDRDYPIAIANFAAKNGVGKILTVSSVGADALSNNFYLRTKGEMEAGIENFMKGRAYFFRPSFLVGDRNETRIGEKIGICAMYFINPLLIGSLKKYRSMNIESLAKAMVNVAKTSEITEKVLEYEAIMDKVG